MFGSRFQEIKTFTHVSNTLLDLFGTTTSYDIADFAIDPNLGNGIPLVLTIKGYDAQRLQRNFRGSKNTSNGAAFGTVEDCGLQGRLGGVLHVTLSSELLAIPASYLSTNKLFRYTEISNPRDFFELGETIFLVSHNTIYTIRKNTFATHKFGSNVMSTPHSIDHSKYYNTFVVTTSGTDTVKLFDTSLKLLSTWRAIDNGYNYSLGKGVQKFLTYVNQYSADYIDEVKSYGYEIIELDKDCPKDFPTAVQTTHPNSAIFHPKYPEYVLVTLFGSKLSNASVVSSQEYGSGGQLLALELDSSGFTGKYKVILRNLYNPHCLNYLGGDIYALTQSSKGVLTILQETGFLEFEIVGNLDFTNLAHKKESRPWLQSVEYNTKYGLFTAVDTQTQSIEIIDLHSKRRRSIPYLDENWAVHLAKLL
ncbi:MAG: hypothetical protein R3B92_04385 [Patescibacteria group bacterium]